MKKFFTTLLTLTIATMAWSQTMTLDTTPVTRVENLDLTGYTYYVLQFVNGNQYYINAGSVNGTRTDLSLSTTPTLTDDNVFCIEQFSTSGGYDYRLKTKSGKYLGYNNATVCVYNAIQNEASTNTSTQKTTPVKFVDGTSGITVQRDGTSWKAINYSGTNLKFTASTGETAELQFWPVVETLDHVAPVYLFAGQSNMDGRAAITGFPSYMSDYTTTPATYAYWSYCNGNDWAKTKFAGKLWPYQPYNDQTSSATVATNTGFDGVVYHQLEEALQKRFFVIKESLGGSPIDPSCSSSGGKWWCADETWMTKNPTTSLAKEFTDNIAQCIDNVLSALTNGYDIKCIVWHQGCSDREKPEGYKENLRTLVNYLRNYIAVKTGDTKYLKLPFICCNINPNSTQYDATVDQAKHELAAEMVNFYEVSFADCSLGSDNLHHDAAGYQKGAGRVYDKMVELGLVSTDAWTQETLNTKKQLRDTTPVTRAENLDLTGNTYYVMQFVNGDRHFINSGTYDGTKTYLTHDSNLTITQDNVFCIEPIDPAPTGTYANWQYRLKSKSGKYLGYDGSTVSAFVCLYNAIQNENTTEKLQTLPLLFANGTSGITVQRNGNSWKAINYNGTDLKFTSSAGESAELQFLPVEEVCVNEPAGSAYAFNVHSTVIPHDNVTTGKWYKIQQAGDYSTYHLSSDSENNNIYGTDATIDAAGVWTLESATGGYKIKNFKGEYLTTDGNTINSRIDLDFVGRSTKAAEAAIFTLSEGSEDANNCLFAITPLPTEGYANLHFDSQVETRVFYSNADGPNSQFKLYEVTFSLNSELKVDAIDSNNGKVGYHDATALTEALDNYYNSKITLDDLQEAYDAYLASYVMPKSGHVYRISNISPINNTQHYYLRYESDTNGISLKCNNTNESAAELFVCREVDGNLINNKEKGYLFYGLKNGKYLKWKGESSQTGALDSYDAAECAFRLVKGYKTTCNDGSAPDILGTFHIVGHRDGTTNSAFILKYNNNGSIASWSMAGETNYYMQNVTDSNFSSLMLFEEVTGQGTDITFSDNAQMTNVGYVATYSSNRPMALPEGYKAYWAEPKQNGSSQYIHMTNAGDVIPAETGVVIVQDEDAHTAAPTAYMLPVTTEETTMTSDNQTANKLIGSGATTLSLTNEYDTNNEAAYILTKATPKNGGDAIVGFFKLTVGGDLPAYKSYLRVADTYRTDTDSGSSVRSQVRILWGDDDVATEIKDIDAPTAPLAETYDLSGRRIANPRNGMYIVNGQKVVIK